MGRRTLHSAGLKKLDRQFTNAVKSCGLVSDDDLDYAIGFQDHARKRHKKHFPLDRVLLKFGFLNLAQVQGLYHAIRYYSWRKEDKFFLKIATQSKLLTQKRADQCLKEQKDLYKFKNTIKRVNEIARRRVFITEKQESKIIEAMQQCRQVSMSVTEITLEAAQKEEPLNLPQVTASQASSASSASSGVLNGSALNGRGQNSSARMDSISSSSKKPADPFESEDDFFPDEESSPINGEVFEKPKAQKQRSRPSRRARTDPFNSEDDMFPDEDSPVDELASALGDELMSGLGSGGAGSRFADDSLSGDSFADDESFSGDDSFGDDSFGDDSLSGDSFSGSGSFADDSLSGDEFSGAGSAASGSFADDSLVDDGSFVPVDDDDDDELIGSALGADPLGQLADDDDDFPPMSASGEDDDFPKLLADSDEDDDFLAPPKSKRKKGRGNFDPGRTAEDLDSLLSFHEADGVDNLKPNKKKKRARKDPFEQPKAASKKSKKAPKGKAAKSSKGGKAGKAGKAAKAGKGGGQSLKMLSDDDLDALWDATDLDSIDLDSDARNIAPNGLLDSGNDLDYSSSDDLF